jgi:hypothetical protein
VQGDAGLHRVGEHGEQREQPEGAGAQRLGSGEVRLRRVRGERGGGGLRGGGGVVVGVQADILGRSDDQQDAGQEADGEDGKADGDPAGAPGAV